MSFLHVLQVSRMHQRPCSPARCQQGQGRAVPDGCTMRCSTIHLCCHEGCHASRGPSHYPGIITLVVRQMCAADMMLEVPVESLIWLSTWLMALTRDKMACDLNESLRFSDADTTKTNKTQAIDKCKSIKAQYGLTLLSLLSTTVLEDHQRLAGSSGAQPGLAGFVRSAASCYQGPELT